MPLTKSGRVVLAQEFLAGLDHHNHMAFALSTMEHDSSSVERTVEAIERLAAAEFGHASCLDCRLRALRLIAMLDGAGDGV